MQIMIQEVPRLIDMEERYATQQIAELKARLKRIKNLRKRHPAMQRLCDAMSWSKRERPGRKQLEKFKRYELDLKDAAVIQQYDSLTY